MVEAEQSVAPDIELIFPSKGVEWNWYSGLYLGLRNKKDPVTIRTFLLDVERIMGVENPEWEEIPKEKEVKKAEPKKKPAAKKKKPKKKPPEEEEGGIGLDEIAGLLQ